MERFQFRVWLRPDENPDIEVWYHEFEDTSKSRLVSDWILDSMSDEDLCDAFKLDPEKHWQVIGRGVIRGWYNAFGEYDEQITWVDVQFKEESPLPPKICVYCGGTKVTAPPWVMTEQPCFFCGEHIEAATFDVPESAAKKIQEGLEGETL